MTRTELELIEVLFVVNVQTKVLDAPSLVGMAIVAGHAKVAVADPIGR